MAMQSFSWGKVRGKSNMIVLAGLLSELSRNARAVSLRNVVRPTFHNVIFASKDLNP
ncbi:hypothetical protein Golax_018176, partial [Gossypium laxum]|nr:hypothetical protein [Gossypium laxum]